MSKRLIPARAGSPKARVSAPKQRDKMSRLVKRPDVIRGDSTGLANAPTFDEAAWRKKWDKRLKQAPSPRGQGSDES